MLNHTVRIAIFRLVFFGYPWVACTIAPALPAPSFSWSSDTRPSVMLVPSRNGRNQSQHKLAQNSPFIPLSPKVRQPGPRCCSTAEPISKPATQEEPRRSLPQREEATFRSSFYS